MAEPSDHDFDDNGNLRDISESWSAYQNEGNELPDAFRDDDE